MTLHGFEVGGCANVQGQGILQEQTSNQSPLTFQGGVEFIAGSILFSPNICLIMYCFAHYYAKILLMSIIFMRIST